MDLLKSASQKRKRDSDEAVPFLVPSRHRHLVIFPPEILEFDRAFDHDRCRLFIATHIKGAS